MDTPVINTSEPDERQYHGYVTGLLIENYRSVKASVETRHAEMMQIKQQLQDQVRDLDHVDIANLRQAADMASRVGEFSVEQQKRLERLINSPYFGRIDVRSPDHPDGQAIYIGMHTFDHTEVGQLIYDWRAPISSMFYDFELGDGYFEAPAEFQSMAIVCRTQAEADDLYALLEPVGDVALLNSQSKVFAGGIVITTAYLAKGLEFDKVLVPFCTSHNYQQAIDRHMLYIAVTRAMHSLVVTHCGALTEFLKTAIGIPQPSGIESKE